MIILRDIYHSLVQYGHALRDEQLVTPEYSLPEYFSFTQHINCQDNVTCLRDHFFHVVLRYLLTAFNILCLNVHS